MAVGKNGVNRMKNNCPAPSISPFNLGGGGIGLEFSGQIGSFLEFQGPDIPN